MADIALENLSTGVDSADTQSVGVSLALGNGVSQGMALIKPELAMLGRTVAAHIAMLDQLTKLGGTLPLFGSNMAPISTPTSHQLTGIADLALPESAWQPSTEHAPALGQMTKASAHTRPHSRAPWQPVRLTGAAELAAPSILTADEIPTSGMTAFNAAPPEGAAGFYAGQAHDLDRADEPPNPISGQDWPTQLARPGKISGPRKEEAPGPTSHLAWPDLRRDQAERAPDPSAPASQSPRFHRTVATIGMATRLSQAPSLAATSWAAEVGAATVLPIQIQSPPTLNAGDLERPSAPVINSMAIPTEHTQEPAPQPPMGNVFAPTHTFMQPILRTGMPPTAWSEGTNPGHGPEAAALASTTASQPQPNALSGTQQGTIFLDGTRLGRWIVDHLAKTASRPTTGTTGIDPRINAIYPGAPTGA